MTFDATVIPRWAPGEESRTVVIAPEILSGRRLGTMGPW